MACLCPPKSIPTRTSPKPSTTEKGRSFPTSGDRYIEVDFGKVVIGKKFRKTIKIKNELPSTLCFIVKRDANTNPIYQVFNVDHYEYKVPARKRLECIISFLTYVPNEKYRDTFYIQDSLDNCIKLHVKGESIGPKVNASVSVIYFYTTSKSLSSKQVFELKNVSEVSAIYQFDVNPNEKTFFRLDKTHGVLEAGKHVFVEIKFFPEAQGVYCMDLPCLILYHEPIIVHLVGINFPYEFDNLCKDDIVHYPFTLEQKCGFGAYIMDSLKVTNDTPPVSLCDTFLDFGRFCPDNNENRLCATMVTSLTNHRSSEIEVIWEKDEEGIFQIHPRRAIVPENESILYECQFYPNYKEHLFGKILRANIHWQPSSNATYVVPIDISIRLIGHSFPANKCWIPKASVIPPKIILPACSPAFPSCFTFMIKSDGHLPILFKFLPPKNSNYIMKPMAGLVRNYQIIVVKLQPMTLKNSAYIEQWSVELNGQKDRLICLYVKCQAEWPYLLVGKNNVVEFDSAQPGCQSISQVAIKNPLGYAVDYKFRLEGLDRLKIDKQAGNILPSEKVQTVWYLQSDSNNPLQFDVTCEVYAKQLRVTVGTPVEVIVKITSLCQHSELCALPSFHDFGVIQWGLGYTTDFTLYNFGTSPMHYTLKCEKILEHTQTKISAYPLMDSLARRQKHAATVFIQAKDVGSYTIQVFYLLRMHEFTDEVSEGNTKPIFRFKYTCVYPTLRVTQISHHNFGPLFSKLDLWEFLQIDQINNVLNTIKYSETKTVHVYLPEVEMQDKKFEVGFSVCNITQYRSDFVLKRQKICDCSAEVKPLGLTSRTRIFNCQHREMLKMNVIGGDSIEGYNSSEVLIEVTYILLGTTELVYNMMLSNDRILKLHFHLECISPEEQHISFYNPTQLLHMNDTFVGQKDPSFQAFWMYNNTRNSTSYTLDKETCDRVNTNFGVSIWTCKNSFGFVEPYKALPMIFRFAPITSRLHDVVVPISMETCHIELQLEGRGTLEYNNASQLVSTMPKIPILFDGNAVEFSSDYVNVELFVHSQKYHLIYIQNKSETHTFKYNWPDVSIGGIIHIEMHKKEGFLHPKQIEAVKMKIVSFESPCRISVNLSVELIDYTNLKLSEKSRKLYEIKQQEAEDCFEITDDLIERHPQNKFEIIPPPDMNHETLVVNVNVISMEDRDLCLSVKKQAQLAIPETLQLLRYHMSPKCPENEGKCVKQEGLHDITKLYRTLHNDKEEMDIIRITIESIIADVIFSNLYVELTKSFCKESEVYYIQVKQEKKNQEQKQKTSIYDTLENHLKQPKPDDIYNILEMLIIDSVEDVFKISKEKKEVHLKPKCKDIMKRHICHGGICYVENLDQ